MGSLQTTRITYLKPKTVTQPLRNTKVRCHSLPPLNKLDPDFIHAYTTSICNSNKIEEVRKCLECLDIPPYDVQVKVMHTLRELSKSYDVTMIQGPLMHLLSNPEEVTDAKTKVEELLTALLAYEEAASVLKDLAIDAMPDLCHHIGLL